MTEAFEPDHNPMPEGMAHVDFGVIKDVTLAGLHRVAQAVKFATRMPQPFASHGRHTFDHPLDTPIEQPAQDWTDRRIPDVAGRDLLPNIVPGEN